MAHGRLAAHRRRIRARWHARQPERWEFVEGWPRLMAPASIAHSIIKRNVFRALDGALADGPCEALVGRGRRS